MVVTLSYFGKEFFIFNNIKTMSFKSAIERGRFFGFIPHRLEIQEKPELNNFPLNVMFTQYKVENDKTIMGTALYEPFLGSFKRDGEKLSMEYQNVYGGDGWLSINYNEADKSYRGEKFVNGKSAGMSFGVQWNMFFVHFTALGIENGEQCEFKEVK